MMTQSRFSTSAPFFQLISFREGGIGFSLFVGVKSDGWQAIAADWKATGEIGEQAFEVGHGGGLGDRAGTSVELWFAQAAFGVMDRQRVDGVESIIIAEP